MASQDETIKTVTNNKWKVGTVIALVIAFLGVANTYNVFGGYFWTASAQAIHVQEQATKDAKQDKVVNHALDVNQMQRQVLNDQMHLIQVELAKLTVQVQEMNRRLDRERRNR